MIGSHGATIWQLLRRTVGDRKERLAMQTDPRDFARALAGIDYPISRDAIVRSAADKGGINNEILQILERIPDQTYETEPDLMRAISEVYVTAEGFMEPTPAAPAQPAAKDAAAAGAETEDHSAA
jgi:hypothetical protein